MSYVLNSTKNLQPAPAKRALRCTQRRRRRGISFIRRCGITLLYCCIAYGIVSTAVPAYLQAHRLQRDEDHLRLQINAAEQQHVVLETKVQVLRTPEGEQNAARPYGWLLKGERAIACPHADDALSHASDGQLLAIAPRRDPTTLERLKKAVEW